MDTQFPKIEMVCSINGDPACIATFETNWASTGGIWREQDATNQEPAFLFVFVPSGFPVRKAEVDKLGDAYDVWPFFNARRFLIEK